MSVNGPISPKQCYYEMEYSFYSFYWLDSLEIRLDHNSTYYRSLSKNSDVKPRISHCDYQNLQYKTHPEFWPFHRRIFKTSLYYKTRLILETRRYIQYIKGNVCTWVANCLFGHKSECYFGVYFPCCEATREINTQITLLWPCNCLLGQYIYYLISYMT